MADEGLTWRNLRNTVLFAALVYLAIQFIQLIANFLLILSISAIITVILDPIVSWLNQHRIPRPVSAGVLALLLLGLLFLLLYLIIPPAQQQLEELWEERELYIERIQLWVNDLVERYPALADYAPDPGALTADTVQRAVNQVISSISRLTASVAGIITGTILVFILTIYMLSNPRPLIDGILKAVGKANRPRVRNAGHKLAVQIRAWALGVLTGMFVIFGLTWLGLAIIGVEGAFLFAVIAGLLEAVPVVGPIISAIPPIIVALLQEPILALWVALLFTGIQQIEGNILIPMIMSRQLSLHPVTVIFAVLVMGALFGIIGVFLAAPAAAAAGVVYDELYLQEYQEQLEHPEQLEQEQEEQEE